MEYNTDFLMLDSLIFIQTSTHIAYLVFTVYMISYMYKIWIYLLCSELTVPV